MSAPKYKNKGAGAVIWLVMLCLALFFFAPQIAPWSERLIRKIQRELGLPASPPKKTTPAKVVAPPPKPKPTIPAYREIYVPYKKMETAQLFNEARLAASLETTEGKDATAERKSPDSYKVTVEFSAKIPKATRDGATLLALNPNLARLLPGLPALLDASRISGLFDVLYQNKVRSLHSNLTRLDRILSRHNFYDCETILELSHPVTGRKGLFIQAEMDVVSDGSDSDRYIKVDGTSDFFQPFTSYKWPKKTEQPNPFMIAEKQKLATLQKEASEKGVSPNRLRELREEMEQARVAIRELGKFSFLVAKADPFIVLPGYMFRFEEGPFRPSIGDYAVVIYKSKILPAIVGDVGPSHKMGEASLRIAWELNPDSNSYRRPISELEVTYLIFPGTAEKPFDAPNLAKWNDRCRILFEEMGGNSTEMLAWTALPPDREELKPTPTPSPLPAPTNPVVPSAAPLATNSVNLAPAVTTTNKAHPTAPIDPGTQLKPAVVSTNGAPVPVKPTEKAPAPAGQQLK